ncbi:MAG: DUF2844 domain-containing protein [Gammaproteobacteria bacterium]|jgi:hypothetical protein
MQSGGRKTRGSSTRAWLMSALLLGVTVASEPVWAALGGDMESVDTDQGALNASEQISATTQSYTVYELQTTAGIVVREYLSLDGSVFAVSWQGPALPNLRQILGGYFARYTEAAQKQSGGHGHQAVHLPDLVVESSGHMRAFFGRAYLPKALPQGVTAADIK